MKALPRALPSVIAQFVEKDFEQNLRKIIASSSTYTDLIGGYILESGGKRIRPRIVSLVGEALGLSHDYYMPFAYTVELMHTASLLHDDVVDGTEIRRSRPTANQVFGDKPALLAGDFISATAIETMCAIGNMRLALAMVQTIKKMAEGELKELEHAGSFHDDLDVYLEIIYLKTASLFELCSLGPGLIAEVDEPLLARLSSYGRGVGMAFQIVDDIINLCPDASDNKDAYNDIVEGKSTLPLVLLFRERPEVLKTVGSLSGPEEHREYLVAELEPSIFRQCKDMAADYLERAVNEIRMAGLFSDALADIPKQIMAQIDGRF
ncbi:MAG TPA: polyprenyl synthetase family protein [Deltaproteobacteria bacterium]|nr:polyprenyl synthetase family protein [Deltaproteobacteria bacterium]HOM29752.1 polyprenyl synthetase family protein [Deltaproteobacteria bacterium]HPP81541.1 polyprenyl synthetase family protein [Deltaproteobacteria bacterium]